MLLFRSFPRHFGLFFLALLCSPFAVAQTSPNSQTSGCPVEFLKFKPWGVSARVKNASGKKIVGLVFNAALADATERWKWYHWNFDETRPIAEFGWNKAIKPSEAKTLTWEHSNLDLEHGGGGAFVLTSVLYEDGTNWEAPKDSAACKYVWYNNHKTSFVRPVALPFRE